jgi:hypothetical protein
MIYCTRFFLNETFFAAAVVLLIKIKSLAPCKIPKVKMKEKAINIWVLSKKNEFNHKQKKLATIANLVYLSMFIYISLKLVKKNQLKNFCFVYFLLLLPEQLTLTLNYYL